MKDSITNDKNNIRSRAAVNKVLCGVAVLLLVLALCPMLMIGAEEQTVQVGIPVEEHPELFITRSMPTHGEGTRYF